MLSLMKDRQLFQTDCAVTLIIRTSAKINLVELGAGNGYKTNLILDEFLKKKIKKG